MPVSAESTQRMREGRRRLAMARQRLRRISLLARNPDELDTTLPVLGRLAFMRQVRHAQLQPQEGAHMAAVALLDLAGADELLLREIGMTLLENTRGCDSVGRLGQERFAILLRGAGPQDAARVAQRLRREVHALCARRRRMVRVRMACAGVCEAFDPDALMTLLQTRLPAIAQGRAARPHDASPRP